MQKYAWNFNHFLKLDSNFLPPHSRPYTGTQAFDLALTVPDWVNVAQVRPVIDGDVFFDVDRAAICNTTSFLIKAQYDRFKVLYSTSFPL